uniref:Transmembrane protein n=1 Tax=Manihot esculenta TaxID=3983 RepID=A0A2C9U6W3_MANES
MSDWGAVFVTVVLFIILTPGTSGHRFIEFGNFETSGISILVHSIFYFALISIFLLAVEVHMYFGS